jgi:hypothetical protein
MLGRVFTGRRKIMFGTLVRLWKRSAERIELVSDLLDLGSTPGHDIFIPAPLHIHPEH